MSINWTEDEVVLICAEVKANNWNQIPRDSIAARRLSVLLNESSEVPLKRRPESFRSPGSIHRKSWDIITVLPNYHGTPTKGGKTTRRVVERFLDSPNEMDQIAQDVRDRIVLSHSRPEDSGSEDQFGLKEAYEGTEAEVVLLRRERSPALRRRKLSAVKEAGQEIKCEACGFNFAKIYGEHGKDYIEVHHVLPLHASGPTLTQLDDLMLLCANCHRMIHRSQPWLEPEELKALLG